MRYISEKIQIKNHPADLNNNKKRHLNDENGLNPPFGPFSASLFQLQDYFSLKTLLEVYLGP